MTQPPRSLLSSLVPRAGTLALALAGWGVATVIPGAMVASDGVPGLAPGAGLAVLNWVLRLGFLVSPPLVGLIAEHNSVCLGILIYNVFTSIEADAYPSPLSNCIVDYSLVSAQDVSLGINKVAWFRFFTGGELYKPSIVAVADKAYVLTVWLLCID